MNGREEEASLEPVSRTRLLGALKAIGVMSPVIHLKMQLQIHEWT